MLNIRRRQINWLAKVSKMLFICNFMVLLCINADENKSLSKDKNLEEQRKILLIDNDKIVLGERKPGMTIEIEEVKLPVPVAKLNKKFPIPSAQIEGACFYKNSRPAYFIGAETGLNQYPFLYKMLDLDILQFTGGDYLNSTLQERRDGNTVKLSSDFLIRGKRCCWVFSRWATLALAFRRPSATLFPDM